MVVLVLIVSDFHLLLFVSNYAYYGAAVLASLQIITNNFKQTLLVYINS